MALKEIAEAASALDGYLRGTTEYTNYVVSMKPIAPIYAAIKALTEAAEQLTSADQRIAELEKERGLLRSALAKIIGVDGREELEALEAVMRLMPAPAEDKAASVDAIHALLATLEASKS